MGIVNRLFRRALSLHPRHVSPLPGVPADMLPQTPSTASAADPSLVGGGAMARMIANFDWAATPIGPRSDWPASQRAVVSLILQAPLPIVTLWGSEGVMIYNDAYACFSGDRHPAILGSRVRDAWPEAADFNGNVVREVLSGKSLSYVDQEFLLDLHGQPQRVWMNLDYSPILSETGVPVGVIAVVVDQSDKVRAEMCLEAERGRLRQMFDQAPGGIAMLEGPDHVFVLANAAFLRIIGLTAGEAIGRRVIDVLPEVKQQGFIDLLDGVFESNQPYLGRSVPAELSGTEFILDFLYQPVAAADGTVTGVFVQVEDVTEHKRAEASLLALNTTLEQRVADAVTKRIAAEDALRHAQKMEAIGNLTGGVAHDFNNLLQVVSGNLQLLARSIGDDPRAAQRMQNALASVRHGADLARKLLAFGRRQPLDPKALNAGGLIEEMGGLLRRTIGAGTDITVRVQPDLWTCFVDPVQLETALLNLAINARDAIGETGRLDFEAANLRVPSPSNRPGVQPGEYVAVTVRDTGAGIPPDVLGRVFDPFFTTKSAGNGTGLGLSMVYGFVRQSGGHVEIESTPGEGTGVLLLLPRTHRSEDPRDRTADRDAEAVPEGQRETILVVEDDDRVRETVADLLQDLGYRVLEARDATRALAILDTPAEIDLLFTDVVMPGPVRSPELAHLARGRRPGLAVLFTSGYAEDVIVHDGRLDAGVALLSKPYSREVLARKLRDMLDPPGRPPQPRPEPARMPALPEPETPALPLSAAPSGTVLVVEDEVLIRLNTSDILQEQGLTVLEAGTGADAMVLAAHTAPDVLVVDVGLPDTTGVELARKLRERQAGLPVIFATGHLDVPGAAAIGPPTAILRKPFGEAELCAAVLRFLGSGPA